MKKALIILGILAALIIAYLTLDSLLFDGIKSQQISEAGFQANYFAHDTTQNQTTLILIGGGQWGDYWAGQFAQSGYVGLSLPYTGQDGLPQLPEDIPLEYFESAIQWLGKQKAVNPDKIIVMGASKNAELALVIASMFPEQISGVIAYSPSSVSWANRVLSYNSDTQKASWTYKGADIPYVPMEKLASDPANTPNTLAYWEAGLEKQEAAKAAIPVENIQGPVLLFSGKSDAVWPSVIMADMIETRLRDSAFRYSVENIQYDNAGHLISRNPDSDTDTAERTFRMTSNGQEYELAFGGTMAGDNEAKKRAREKVFAWLDQF